MLLYFKIYFNNIEVISYSNIGPISTRTEEVLKLKICVNNNVWLMSSNLPYIKDRHTEKPKVVLQHSGTVTRKRLSARLSFCVKLATSLRHQYLVLQHPLTLTNLI